MIRSAGAVGKLWALPSHGKGQQFAAFAVLVPIRAAP